VKESQDTSKDEETMLNNALQIQGLGLFDSMDFSVGKKCRMMGWTILL
jgi:hypothetical protein